MEYKGLKYLVEAFKGLDEARFQLTIAGEGVIDCNVEKKNITVINRYIEDDEMNKLFHGTDVLALPYISASQSGVVYLSLAFNKPVIATRVGAIPDAVTDGVNGYLVEPKSPLELTNAIQAISNEVRYRHMVENIERMKKNSEAMLSALLQEAYAK